MNGFRRRLMMQKKEISPLAYYSIDFSTDFTDSLGNQPTTNSGVTIVNGYASFDSNRLVYDISAIMANCKSITVEVEYYLNAHDNKQNYIVSLGDREPYYDVFWGGARYLSIWTLWNYNPSIQLCMNGVSSGTKNPINVWCKAKFHYNYISKELTTYFNDGSTRTMTRPNVLKSNELIFGWSYSNGLSGRIKSFKIYTTE